MSEEIFARVRKIASALFDVPAGVITTETSPASVDSWDSVQHLNLMLELERSFGVTLEPEEMERARTIGELVQVIEKRRESH